MADLHVGPPAAGDEPAAGSGAGDVPPRARRRGAWAEVPALVLVALVLALLLKTFVVQAFYIPSSSMEPTLEVGDRVLVSKLTHLLRDPVRGEVVVFSQDVDDPAPDGSAFAQGLRAVASGLGLAQGDERDFIKRIIGLPGDVVELRDGVVYVNGEELPEAPTGDGGYLSVDDGDDFGPVTVEPDHYFMLGDNRPNSADSRFGLGQIHRDQVLGRAFVTIWPLSSARTLDIPAYSGEEEGG